MSDWSIAGQRIAITGATSGIGRSAATQLAVRGATVIVLGRSLERAHQVRDELVAVGGGAEVVGVDLASLASVEAAAGVISSGGGLSVLINNAGVVGRGVTSDGLERTFGVNLVAPFHLTNRLISALYASPIRPRVVNVSSNAHLGARLPDFDHLQGRTRSLFGVREYKSSKLAMVAWSKALRQRHPEIDVFCAHPGMVKTPIWNIAPQPLRWYLTRSMLTPEEGARTLVRCASDGDLVGSLELYWARESPARPDPRAVDEVSVERVWEWCEKTVSRITGWKPPAGGPSGG